MYKSTYLTKAKVVKFSVSNISTVENAFVVDSSKLVLKLRLQRKTHTSNEESYFVFYSNALVVLV